MPGKDRIYTLILKQNGRELERWALSHESLTIGREHDNDIVIDDQSVSLRHAVLQRTGDGYVLEDRDGGHPVNINGELSEGAPLRDGDTIMLGDYRLFFQVGDSAAGASEDFASAEATIRRSEDDMTPTIEDPAHVVISTPLGEQTFPLDRTVIMIGSGPDADIHVEGRFVAAYHADIVHRDGRYVINHVDGRRKVTVNGRPVKRTVLADGCVIGIADTKLVFRETVRATAGGSSD